MCERESVCVCVLVIFSPSCGLLRSTWMKEYADSLERVCTCVQESVCMCVHMQEYARVRMYVYYLKICANMSLSLSHTLTS